jgi:ketosteroid isomerase-like protein
VNQDIDVVAASARFVPRRGGRAAGRVSLDRGRTEDRECAGASRGEGGSMRTSVATSFALAACLSAAPTQSQTTAELAQQVRAAEHGFATTMALRDSVAFATFIADEAVFFGPGAIRGKAAVVAAWRGFFEGADAPFSWEPETVEVLDSGTLAISSGPVRNPQGQRIGTFNSIWRRAADGRWLVVFDRGCPPCDCAGRSAAGSESAL